MSIESRRESRKEWSGTFRAPATILQWAQLFAIVIAATIGVFSIRGTTLELATQLGVLSNVLGEIKIVVAGQGDRISSLELAIAEDRGRRKALEGVSRQKANGAHSQNGS